MAADIDVDLDDLRVMNDSLGLFVAEFEQLAESTERVRDAVGRPAGEGRLRDRVGSFESGWDGNREVLTDALRNIHDHITAVIDGLDEADRTLAKDSG